MVTETLLPLTLPEMGLNGALGAGSGGSGSVLGDGVYLARKAAAHPAAQLCSSKGEIVHELCCRLFKMTTTSANEAAKRAANCLSSDGANYLEWLSRGIAQVRRSLPARLIGLTGPPAEHAQRTGAPADQQFSVAR